ncbi:MAG: hypothetical protein R6V35_00950 [Candidatus Nanohaloarchaea archaeon]
MDRDIFKSLVTEYGFEKINIINDSRVEDLEEVDSYELGSADLNFYRIDLTFRDVNHPFGPSETILGEVIDKTGFYPRKRYVSGSQDNFEDIRTV